MSEKKSFIKSFVKEVVVTGDEALLKYTIPLTSKGETEERLGVPRIVHFGGPYVTFAKPDMGTLFEVYIR